LFANLCEFGLIQRKNNGLDSDIRFIKTSKEFLKK
jgi:hypothetical protein